MAREIQRINPVGLNDPSNYGYSHVTVVPPGATLVYVAGQLGEDENGNPVSDDFAAQLKQAFSNLRIALVASGATPEQVVKITLYPQTILRYLNRVYRQTLMPPIVLHTGRRFQCLSLS